MSDVRRVLWEREQAGALALHLPRGHTFTSEALLDVHRDQLEGALAGAVRALEESAALHNLIATRARQQSLGGIADHYERQAQVAQQRSRLTRSALVSDPAAESRAGEGA
jgi:hypothetical protein